MKLKVHGLARLALYASAVVVAALLASCGGGQQVQPFIASRVIAFGDESSVINADRSKYTVNALVPGTTNTLDCVANPLWIQSVALYYGLTFPQCPAINETDQPASRIYATVGATSADVPKQIQAFLTNEGSFNSAGDMVTLFVGANDILAQFAQYPGVGEATLAANLTAAGVALATQVNSLAASGVRVLISTAPDMGLTPFSGDRSVGSTNTNPALLSRLSLDFNNALLAALTNDGRVIGLIQLDQYIETADLATFLLHGAFNNTTQASCTVPTPACTSDTLVPEAANSIWLWADNLHLSAVGQASLASLAVQRAQSNPF
jgi:outer membrane lipase/esterase